jgi:hypothetical protein
MIAESLQITRMAAAPVNPWHVHDSEDGSAGTCSTLHSARSREQLEQVLAWSSPLPDRGMLGTMQAIS